jgi:alkylhydroperoxidase family enzyme
LPADQWDDTTRQALSGLPEERRNPEGAGNLLSTLVRHPKLAQAFLRFNFHLLYGSTLPPRLRELAILRVAHRTASTYEWGQHVLLGRKAGLSDDEIAAVARGEAADGFDGAILHSVDELLDNYELSDATWSALSDRLDERQRMDLMFTIGCYAALAMAFNTFGVELEDDYAAREARTREER